MRLLRLVRETCVQRECVQCYRIICVLCFCMYEYVFTVKKKREKQKQKDTSLITFIPLCVNSHVGGRHSGLYPIHQPADTA